MKIILAMATALSLLAAPAVWAAPCKDPKTGKFVKCPEAKATTKRCKDTKGKFAKCGTPGAKPA
ncbi:hypothetical protein ABC347_14225 [Sphingomonas sp. 1P06PA]|uniref:hypothetical protein n=1 Tax=Sphingomonas sp. 1P06PA TaxID=554121 RepID=UPI0039A49F84